MKNSVEVGLLWLQAFQVTFLLLHDWIPLGRFNDLGGVRSVDSLPKRIVGTAVSTLPFAVLLVESYRYGWAGYPHELRFWLWVAYGLLFAGELRAWWIPYLVWPEPERAARYRIRFARTYRLLPERNGIAPDALHTILHLSTAATLALLACL